LDYISVADEMDLA